MSTVALVNGEEAVGGSIGLEMMALLKTVASIGGAKGLVERLSGSGLAAETYLHVAP